MKDETLIEKTKIVDTTTGRALISEILTEKYSLYIYRQRFK